MNRPDPIVTPATATPATVTPATATPAGARGARGRVVLVGGTARTPGAVLLAGEAALRAGAVGFLARELPAQVPAVLAELA